MIDNTNNPNYDTKKDERNEVEHDFWLTGINSLEVADFDRGEAPTFPSAYFDAAKDSYGNDLDIDSLADLYENHKDILIKECFKLCQTTI